MSDETEATPAVPIDDLEPMRELYRRAKKAEADWKEIKDHASSQIKARLEESNVTVGTVGGRPAIHYRFIPFQRFDSKKLKAKDPAKWAEYATDGGRWDFDVLD